MSAYRFSWLRPSGWTRLGLAGAVAVLFVTPMLWALGVFGADEATLKRTLVFLAGGMWFFAGLGYMLGWALRGFVVKVRDSEDEDAPHRPAAHPPGGLGHAAPTHAPAGAPHRPGH